MRPLPLAALAAALATLSGCVAHATRDLTWGLPRDAVVRYAFHTEHQVATEILSLPADIPDGPEVAGLREALSAWTFTLEGEMEQSLARVFRDGTWGRLVRVVKAEGGQSSAAGRVPIEAEGLLRKSVIVRGWPSGETFELAGFAQLAGVGRMVEMWFDLFTQLAIRLPRQVPTPGGEETEEPAAVTLKVPLARGASLEQSWVIRWRAAGRRPCGDGQCIELGYRATVTETSTHSRPDRRIDGKGEGTVEGAVLMAEGDHQMVAHEYRTRITRELTTYEVPVARKQDGPVRSTLRVTDQATAKLERRP